ncbi:Intraflagellar transport protein 88, partial [Cladochytrium tenue]
TVVVPEKPAEPQPEEQIKALEGKVQALVNESSQLSGRGDHKAALDKAKEAVKRERAVVKQREQAGLSEQVNLDLTYWVQVNLAGRYEACGMGPEALAAYGVVVKNRLFNQAGRLRVNMGNIYFAGQKYAQAVKMYRMALDQIPNTSREIRLKIMKNIGNAFVKMGQFQDAITSYESIMEISPDFHTGFNLILCYFALGDRERMRRGLQGLVSIRRAVVEQGDELGLGVAGTGASSASTAAAAGSASDDPIEDHEVFNEDRLRAVARARRMEAEKYMILAAKLVAPNVDANFASGFDWVIETVRASQHPEIASELEIAKAVYYLKMKNFQKAIEALKAFEKKDQKLAGTAATNLSFLYFLEGEFRQAEKYAEAAVAADRYNAKALTNLGNCQYQKGSFDKAKEYYQEAVNVDALCTEAMYNL